MQQRFTNSQTSHSQLRQMDQLQSECESLKRKLALLNTQHSQKVELLQELKKELLLLEKTSDPAKVKYGIGKLIRKIRFDQTTEYKWDYVSHFLDQSNQEFLSKLTSKFPNLSPKDHKLSIYLRLHLTTKDIAPLLNISIRGVEISRYRLRKKLALEPGQNLVNFLTSL